jgi:beta-lactamase regulating signal transducer with metallopeptidase domain
MLVEAMAWAMRSCLQASVVLAIALAVTLTMRRASASIRHCIWRCAVVAVFLSPVMIALSPKWNLAAMAGLERIAFASTESWMADGDVGTSVERDYPVSTAAPGRRSSAVGSVPFLAFLWVSGTTAILLYAFLGGLAVRRMRRSTEPVPVECLDELLDLAETHQVRGAIGIAVSDLTSMPIVCGVWRPVIILPRGASEWSPERLRVVLTHELAHIKRGDCFTQAMTRLVCAAYWFNPLVWIASRRLRVEQELACDDFVLSAGTKASAYARHLSGIARGTQPARMSPLTAATLAMARRSQIESRLMAILDPTIQRGSDLGARVAGAAMILLVAVVLSALQPRPAGARETVAKAPDATSTDTSAALIAAAHQGRIEEVRRLLEQGAGIDSVSGGWNALIAAAHQGQEQTVGLLLDRGANLEAAPGGRNALVAAAHQGQVETVGLLLDRGADANAAPDGQSALDAAFHQGHLNVVNVLVERGADIKTHPSVRARE